MRTPVPVLALLLCTAPAAAGDRDRDSGGWRIGLGALVGTPRGAFDAHAGTGGGVAGHALWAPGRVFGLRLDGSFLIYGSETVPRPFRGTGGRVGLSVRTDNWIGTLALGPQLMARSGRVRPYANAFAGVSYFSTTSELLGPDELSVLASTTNHDDATFAYGGGAGVLFGLGSGEWALDLGARYVANGRVSYLAEGDLVEDRRGARFSPRRSEAETVEVRLGVVFRP